MPNVDTPVSTISPPVVTQGPITPSAPLNAAIGVGVPAATGYGLTMLTGDVAMVPTSLFLNMISQLVKKLRWFPEHEGLIVIMLLLSFAVGYFLLYEGDKAHAFVNAANSTAQAMVNYKGDKASGFNVLPPTPAHLEFGT